jgi:hypothetical protein
MNAFNDVIRNLQIAENALKKQLAGVQTAIASLQGAESRRISRHRTTPRRRRRMSAAARARIAAAQRARWAKYRTSQQSK